MASSGNRKRWAPCTLADDETTVDPMSRIPHHVVDIPLVITGSCFKKVEEAMLKKPLQRSTRHIHIHAGWWAPPYASWVGANLYRMYVHFYAPAEWGDPPGNRGPHVVTSVYGPTHS